MFAKKENEELEANSKLLIFKPNIDKKSKTMMKKNKNPVINRVQDWMKEKEFKIKTMKDEEEIKRQKKLQESMKPALIKNKIKMESKVKKFLENFEESTKNHFIETIKKRANTPDFDLKSHKIDLSFQQLKGTIRKDLFNQ